VTTTVVALPLSIPEGGAAKKKRVLLLDTSQTKRDLRADVMRKLGIEVDCAADILEARCWWRADLYNLVLINVAGKMIRGISSAPRFEAPSLRNGLLFSWAAPNTSPLHLILTNHQPGRMRTPSTGNWLPRC